MSHQIRDDFQPATHKQYFVDISGSMFHKVERIKELQSSNEVDKTKVSSLCALPLPEIDCYDHSVELQKSDWLSTRLKKKLQEHNFIVEEHDMTSHLYCGFNAREEIVMTMKEGPSGILVAFHQSESIEPSFGPTVLVGEYNELTEFNHPQTIGGMFHKATQNAIKKYLAQKCYITNEI